MSRVRVSVRVTGSQGYGFVLVLVSVRLSE